MFTYSISSMAFDQLARIFNDHRAFDEALNHTWCPLFPTGSLPLREKQLVPLEFTHSFPFKKNLIVLNFKFTTPELSLSSIHSSPLN